MGESERRERRMRGDWLFPTEIRFGAGRVEELGDLCLELGIIRPLIVTDRGLAATPIFEHARRAAARPEVLAQAFTEVQENPTGGNVEAGVAAFRAAPGRRGRRPGRRQRHRLRQGGRARGRRPAVRSGASPGRTTRQRRASAAPGP